MTIALVTATMHPDRSAAIRHQWPLAFGGEVDLYTVYNGATEAEGPPAWLTFDGPTGGRRMYLTQEILGVVPAFAIGVQRALEDGAEIIACLHDDLEIHGYEVGNQILDVFEEVPTCGLLGFGGGRGLGDSQLYNSPFDPMQLARKDFISNLVDAEAHGRRVLVPTRVACLDGFSQIGRAAFWAGDRRGTDEDEASAPDQNLFAQMTSWGVIHHFYDSMLGCFAKRLGWEVWMLPIRCRHLGGQTAVGDPRYAEWARQFQHTVLDFGTRHVTDVRGDQLFWEQAHQIGYTQFRDVLPITLEETSHAPNPV